MWSAAGNRTEPSAYPGGRRGYIFWVNLKPSEKVCHRQSWASHHVFILVPNNIPTYHHLRVGEWDPTSKWWVLYRSTRTSINDCESAFVDIMWSHYKRCTLERCWGRWIAMHDRLVSQNHLSLLFVFTTLRRYVGYRYRYRYFPIKWFCCCYEL